MFWEYFVYWVIAGIVNTIISVYIVFVSTGKFELKLNEIPILCFAILVWPLIMVAAICHVFENFGNKSIFKITRKEKK